MSSKQKKAAPKAAKAPAPKQKPAQPRAAPLIRQPFPVHDCTRDYWRTMVDPVNAPAGACLPGPYPVASRRAKVFTRFVMEVQDGAVAGTSGFGYVLCRPMFAAMNDLAVAYWTNVDTQATTVVSTATGINTSTSNSDYANADFGASATTAQTRMVAFGIRVTNLTPALYASGAFVPFVSPDHQTVDGSTPAQLLAFDRNQPRALKPGESTEIVLGAPIQPSERDFNGSITGVAWSALCCGFFITGANTTVTNSFMVEVVGHFEFIGSNVRGKIPGHSDPDGLAAAVEVDSAVKESGQHFSPKATFDTIHRVYQGLKTGVSVAAEVGKALAPAATAWAFKTAMGAAAPGLIMARAA